MDTDINVGDVVTYTSSWGRGQSSKGIVESVSFDNGQYQYVVSTNGQAKWGYRSQIKRN